MPQAAIADDSEYSRQSECIQVSALIPPAMRELARRRARKMDMSLSIYIRSLIAKDLGVETGGEMPRPPSVAVVACPVQTATPVNSSRSAFAAAFADGSILDLASRGHTAMQIAAIKRIGYREVLAKIASDVDWVVEAGRG